MSSSLSHQDPYSNTLFPGCKFILLMLCWGGGGVVLIRKFLNSYLWLQLKKKTTCGNFLSLLLCLLLRFRVRQRHLVSTFWFTISYGRRSIFLCCVFFSISPPRSSFILETYTSRIFSKCFRQIDWTLESKGKIQRWSTGKQK